MSSYDIERKDPCPRLDDGARYLNEGAHADPMFIDKDCLFWFFEETWDDPHGPYSTLREAMDTLTEYAKNL